MFGIDKVLLDKFAQMPVWVRVVTYLVFLLLFVYLVLVPRFVDGQLVVRDKATGGLLPYRGADLQVLVDGRSYKFRSNEEGFFSIPIIGRLPEAIDVQVLHVDRGFWFPITFSIKQIWVKRSHIIEILDANPFVRLTEREEGVSSASSHLWTELVRSAAAQTIELPPTLQKTIKEMPSVDRISIQKEIETTYAKVSGRPAQTITPKAHLAGADGLNYTQRIQLITSIERDFKLKIDDEHWQSMTSLEQLSDYVAKRKIIQQAAPATGRYAPWSQIQQAFPVDDAPVYRRQ